MLPYCSALHRGNKAYGGSIQRQTCNVLVKLKNLSQRKFLAKDVTGLEIGMSIAELITVVLSRQCILYQAFAFGLLLLSDPPSLLSHLSMPAAALVWLVAFIQYFVMFFMVCFAFVFAQSRGWIGFVRTPFIGLITITPIIATCEIFIHWLSGPEYNIVLLPRVLTYFLILQLFEGIFMRYVLPHLREDENHAIGEAEPDGPRICIGGRQIRTDKILYLEAQEHFVRIVMTDETFSHRVRLGDLVAQLDESMGIQPHRSWWVSQAAQPRLVKQGAKYGLHLVDGTEVPLARARIDMVSTWLGANGFEHASSFAKAAE